MEFRELANIPDDAFDEPKKKVNHKQQGKRNRAMGLDTERRTKKDLEEDGWIVSKWNNNIDLKEDKLIPVKNKFRGVGIPMMLGAGFPDFIAYRKKDKFYEVIGVEVKTTGYLSSVEQEKCKWLLKNNIFSKILIARREYSGRYIEIKYKEFEVKK